MKKTLAVLLTASLVVANIVPVFAATTGESSVSGNGIVEYDDSKAVVYDSVTVPTLTASKYNFEIDPTGLLHEYDSDKYDTGSVYFSSVSTHESLVPNATKLGTDKLYTSKKAEYAKDSESGKWKGIVKTASTDSTTGDITVTALNEGFYAWTPVATASADYTSGKNGEFTELTAANFSNWFKVSGNDTDGYELDTKNDYKSGANVCDGKIYTVAYEEIPAAGIVEAVGSTVAVEDYATVTTAGDTTTVTYTNVYTRSGEGTEASPYAYTILAANSDKMDYTPEEATKNGSTDSVDVTNLSTRDKKVTAVVTLKNATGLAFKANPGTYSAGDATTSVYFAATDGTTSNALVAAEDGKTATATYQVTIPKKGGSADVTYQTTDTNAAGGHKYARYEGAFPTYNTKAFYITATANSDAAAKDAWNTWAKGITATTRPEISIVYKVENVLTAEEQAAADAQALAAKVTAFLEANEVATKAVADVVAGDLEDIVAAQTAFAALGADVKTALAANDPAVTAETLQALKDKCDELQITDETGSLAYYSSSNDVWVGKTSSTGLSSTTFNASDVSSVTIKKDSGEAKDVTSSIVIKSYGSQYYVTIPWTAVEAAGVTYAAGSTYTVVVVKGTTRYTASTTF